MAVTASDRDHDHVLAGSYAELRRDGRLLTKVGVLPVVVVWDGEAAYAIEDRCPHLGFPLRQGTVEPGMITCHWHHARFDLVSGCTFDPWADDATAFDVHVDGDEVWVVPRPAGDRVAHLQERLRQGLEGSISLVVAKAVLGLLDAGVDPAAIVRTGIEFGVANRAEGWGAGLTVLVGMANLLPHLDAEDRPLALVHGLMEVARDTAGHPPRFAEPPLATTDIGTERLAGWYRRFVETRSPDGAERTLATALAALDAGRVALADVEAMLTAAATDHVLLDEGHTLDFTNKAMEAVGHLGPASAPVVLPSVVRQTALAERSEEQSEWRHPVDLVALLDMAVGELPERVRAGPSRSPLDEARLEPLAWQVLDDEPGVVLDALLDAVGDGATGEQLGRAVAYAAALRIVRFHTRNDVGDWNTVHHAFTTANALHQTLQRVTTPEAWRGVLHSALRVHLDRFLNVPAARLPTAQAGDLAELAACWDRQGAVDEAAAIVAGHLRAGGDRRAAIAALGRGLLAEDAGFHWYQLAEAGARQSLAWPEGSEPPVLILAGVARFLAAHTPTRRERPTVVRTAARLRRGEALFED